MSSATAKSPRQIRATTSMIASILLGLVLLASGSGKVIGFGEMPGQALEFLDVVIPDFLLTPAIAIFIGTIFLPHIIPWAELCLGILLVLRIWPRFIAALCIPLILAFMASNSWLISKGMKEFASCECFGIWEEIFGTLTPLQSFYVDIGLFVLALIIICAYRVSFFALPSWLAKLKEGKKTRQRDS